MQHFNEFARFFYIFGENFPLIKIKILNKLVKLMKTVKITIVLTLIVWFTQSGCKKNDCEKTDWKKTVFVQWNTTLFVVTII